MSNKIPSEGAAAKLTFWILTSPGPILQGFSAQSRLESSLWSSCTCNHLCMGAAVQSFSLIPCIRAVPHSGSQAFPSNAVFISSFYQEIWYQEVNVHPLVLFPPFSLCARRRQPVSLNTLGLERVWKHLKFCVCRAVGPLILSCLSTAGKVGFADVEWYLSGVSQPPQPFSLP